MNVQQLQATAYRHIAGTVQVPLVMLVWGALVLFFGYQYQANALLPGDNGFNTVVSLESDDLLRAQDRNERLLAALAAQTPVPVPSLLDRQAFAAELAAELADYELRNEAGSAVSIAMNSSEHQLKGVQGETVSKVVVARALVESVVAEPVKTSSFNDSAEIKVKTKTNQKMKAAKFVRLPAVVQRTAAMRVDALRASKDGARMDLLAGRSSAAYKRLRGKIAQGRTDIEFLGLLALASLPQQPGEAEVIYQHLTQLQPDAQRWRQGLVQSQRQLAQRSENPNRAGEPSLSPVGVDGQSGLAG